MFFYTDIIDDNLIFHCIECGMEQSLPLYQLKKTDLFIIRDEGTIAYEYSLNPPLFFVCSGCGWNVKTKNKLAQGLHIYNIEHRMDVEYFIANQKSILKDKALMSKRHQTMKQREIDEINKDKAINVPKCPTCNSQRIEKLSSIGKVASVAAFGILGVGKASKTFKCNNCGYTW